MSVNANARPVLTESQARAAQVKFEQLCADLERGRAERGQSGSAHDYLIYRELFAAAYGSQSVQVVADPPPTTASGTLEAQL